MCQSKGSIMGRLGLCYHSLCRGYKKNWGQSYREKPGTVKLEGSVELDPPSPLRRPNDAGSVRNPKGGGAATIVDCSWKKTVNKWAI